MDQQRWSIRSTEFVQRLPIVIAEPVLVAIDPGIDAVGVAIYLNVDSANSLAGRRLGDVTAIGRALLEVRTIRTSAAETLCLRLRKIDEQLRALLASYSVVTIVIELPAIVGTYHRNRHKVGRDGMADGMSKLFLAAGALYSTSLSVARDVRFVNAPRQHKHDRQMLSAGIFKASPAAGNHPARLPSGDALDAVWLGAQQLEAGSTT